ncbi:MAG: hypothetical protein JW821_00160 [Deltaproteobacteria bacterium]|nr:hypothetical protein [Deltaproteobacteria bacterium]
MPYILSQEAMKGILILRFYGAVNPMEHLQALNDIVRKCREYHFRKILIDAREPSQPMTAAYRQTFESTISDMSPSRDLRVAYLFENTEREGLSEGEKRKPKGLRTELFYKMEEASQWLIRDD